MGSGVMVSTFVCDANRPCSIHGFPIFCIIFICRVILIKSKRYQNAFKILFAYHIKKLYYKITNSCALY